MADDVTLPGTGVVIAADDIGGKLHQRVKIVVGADGVSGGDVSSANPLPVSDAGGSLTVDGTVAISGTVPVSDGGGSITVDAIALPLPTGAATAAKQPALGTAGAASADVLSVQGVASMTALKVDGSAVTQPVSIGAAVPVTDNAGSLTVDDGGGSLTVDGTVSITANSAVNVAQVGGTAADTNSGVKSAGTLRVVLATDQPQLTNKLLVTPDANSAVNLAQVGGTNLSTGNGASGAGVPRVTLASDSTGQVALAAGSATVGATFGLAATITPSAYARPADTNTYAVDDCWSTSTSAPANITFSTVNRASGKSVQICGLVAVGSVHNATAPLQAELWLFDSAPTAVNDNANHALSDADAAKVVARIPFTLSHNMANNDVGFGDFSLSGFPVVTPTGTDLIGQVRVKNAYVPSSAETLTFRLQVLQVA